MFLSLSFSSLPLCLRINRIFIKKKKVKAVVDKEEPGCGKAL